MQPFLPEIWGVLVAAVRAEVARVGTAKMAEVAKAVARVDARVAVVRAVESEVAMREQVMAAARVVAARGVV